MSQRKLMTDKESLKAKRIKRRNYEAKALSKYKAKIIPNKKKGRKPSVEDEGW